MPAPPPRPKPGSLPVEKQTEFGPPHPAQFAVPEFIPAGELYPPAPPREQTSRKTLAKIRAAASQIDKLRVEVRDGAFDEWVRRCTVHADSPREWTRAAVLYANYLQRAGEYGRNRTDKRLVERDLATETRFGILLRDAGFAKNRRRAGWYYPLRLKQGA